MAAKWRLTCRMPEAPLSRRLLTRPRRDHLLWLALLLLPLLSVAAAIQVQRAGNLGVAATLPVATPAAHQRVAMPAPELALPRLDTGAQLRLDALRGRPVIVNFWASWCAPCRRELPALEAFARRHSGPDAMQVLAVNVGEATEQVRSFLDEAGVRDLRVLLDTDSRANAAWGAFALPASFLIDRAGRIRAMKAGEITTAELQHWLAQAEA